MCGITGYIGDRPAAPILVDSLFRLEYRGYDSAGIATLEKDSTQTQRILTPAAGPSDSGENRGPQGSSGSQAKPSV